MRAWRSYRQMNVVEPNRLATAAATTSPSTCGPRKHNSASWCSNAARLKKRSHLVRNIRRQLRQRRTTSKTKGSGGGRATQTSCGEGRQEEGEEKCRRPRVSQPRSIRFEGSGEVSSPLSTSPLQNWRTVSSSQQNQEQFTTRELISCSRAPQTNQTIEVQANRAPENIFQTQLQPRKETNPRRSAKRKADPPLHK